MSIDQFYIKSDDRGLCTITHSYNPLIKHHVFFFHGLMETKVEKEFLFTKLSRDIAKKFPVKTFQFDFSGHGDSSGELSSFCLEDWIADALSIVNHSMHKNENKTIHFIGSGIGNIILQEVANIIKTQGNNIDSKILICPSNDFRGFQQTIGVVNSYFSPVISLEEYLDVSNQNVTISESMALFETTPTFKNESLHKYLIRLGSFNYDNIVAEINCKLVEEIEEVKPFENFDTEIPTLLIEGTINSWFNKKNLKENMYYETIQGENETLFNHPLRQQAIISIIEEFYKRIMVNL